MYVSALLHHHTQHLAFHPLSVRSYYRHMIYLFVTFSKGLLLVKEYSKNRHSC